MGLISPRSVVQFHPVPPADTLETLRSYFFGFDELVDFCNLRFDGFDELVDFCGLWSFGSGRRLVLVTK